MSAPAAVPPPVDRARAGAFADSLRQALQGSVLTMLIDVGHRSGLLGAAAAGPGTAAEIAARADCHERPTREWCGAMAVAKVLDYDAATARFTFPPEHAMWLTGSKYTNLAPVTGLLGGLALRADDVVDAFRTGAGVPYERYRPHFTHAMDAVGRARYDALLVSTYLPLAPGLVERLERGADALDVGCGTGHCLNVMARAFPRSRFTGYDFSADAIELASTDAAAMGLTNVVFEERDVSTLPDAAFDVIFAFDAIHDQVDPGGVLRQMRGALRAGGDLFMVDTRASSSLERNIEDPSRLFLYGTSLFHCMQVSLAGGGPGLGAVWGVELATSMLRDAGFAEVTTHELDADPTNCIYVCRPKP